MSGGMYGADVAQLRELARQLQAASDRLDGSRRRIGTDIRIAAWIGPVAGRFRMQWDNDYSRRVQAASDALEMMATAIIRDAEEQERASARSSGAIGGGRQVPGMVPVPNHSTILPYPFPPRGDPSWLDPRKLVWPGGSPFLPSPGWLTDIGDWVGDERRLLPEFVRNFTIRAESILGTAEAAATAVGWLRTLQETKILRSQILASPAVGGALLPLNAMLSGISTAEAIDKGDVVGAWLNGGSGVLTAAGDTAGLIVGGTAATGLGVTGAGIGALKGLIDFSLPYNAEKQDATYRQGVENLFGPSVDADNLTSEQAQRMSHRYEGWGVANMISDQMQASGKPIRDNIVAGATVIGDGTVGLMKGISRVFAR